MTLPRFFAPRLDGDLIHLDESEVRHALTSLRLSAGDPVEIFDGVGGVARGRLQADAGAAGRPKKSARTRGTVIVSIETREQHSTPAPRLTLITAACKGDRLHWLIEKCTELGVNEIVLAIFRRSVVNVGEHHLGKLRRAAIEACKQCGRNFLPQISSGASLESLIEPALSSPARSATSGASSLTRIGPGVRLVVAHPDEAAPSLARWLAQERSPISLAAIIGPEGGLAPEELAKLDAAGATRVCLGEHILRVETAAIAVAAAWASRPRPG